MPPDAPFSSPAVDLTPIDVVPSFRLVADMLRRRIALGQYRPGDRLPSERDLAELLEVGRMTVRQAIHILQEEGLLATRRGRNGGTRVADQPPVAQIAAETRQALIAVRTNYEFRQVVEPEIAAWAAMRGRKPEKQQIVDLAAENAASVAGYRASDSRFHLAIARVSRNPAALDAVERARAHFFGWADASITTSWEALRVVADRSQQDHVDIANCIRDGDAASARRLMGEHLASGRAAFERIMRNKQRRRR